MADFYDADREAFIQVLDFHKNKNMWELKYFVFFLDGERPDLGPGVRGSGGGHRASKVDGIRTPRVQEVRSINSRKFF